MAERKDKRILFLPDMIELLNYLLHQILSVALSPIPIFLCSSLYSRGQDPSAFPTLPGQPVSGSFCQWQDTHTRLGRGKEEDISHSPCFWL